MLPEITDALIVRAVQSTGMVGAGQSYWRQGRVHQLEASPDRKHVRAKVRGSARLPYGVDLHFADGPAPGLSTACSCPVGPGCKHVAATLFALRAVGAAARRPPEHDVAGSRKEALPATPPLPPALAQWLAAMRPLARAAGVPLVPAAERAIVYVIHAHPIEGKAKAKRAKGGAFPPDPSPCRLAIEALDAPVDGDGRITGAGRKVAAYLLYQGCADLPPHMTIDDQVLIRRLQARIGEIDRDDCLVGGGGFDLLGRIVATGRAYWGGAKGPLLVGKEAVPGTFGWHHDDLGRARLKLDLGAENLVVATLAPPVAIGVASGAVQTVDTGLPAATAEQMLRLPPIAPDAIDLFAASWAALVPASIPPPARPAIRDLGTVTPTPRIEIRIDRVAIEQRMGYRYYASQTIKSQAAIARLSFDYGVARVDALSEGDTLLVRDEEVLVRVTRNVGAESRSQARLLAAGLLPLTAFEDARPTPRQEWDYAPEAPALPEAFTDFLINDAEALRGDGWCVEVAADFPLELAEIDASTLSVAITPSGIDWFDVALGATVDGSAVDLMPALRMLLASPGIVDAVARADNASLGRLALPLGKGKVATIDADRIVPLLRAVLLLAANQPADGELRRLGLARHDLGTLAALEATASDVQWRGAEQVRVLARRLAYLRFEGMPAPDGFAASLRPYQQTGFEWLEALGQAGFGALLADDMGLGKTVQTLAHIAAMKARGECTPPVLIVAPTSVLPNWQSEIARFTPGLAALLLHGADRRERHSEMATHDIVLTSYPLLVRDGAILAGTPFSLIVFDEAHNLKNPRTAGHAAARALVAARKIALTGTPVENRLTDAWALFDLIVPGLLGSLKAFNRDYRNPIEQRGDGMAKLRLARRLKPFMLRRTKDAVAADLPEKSLVPLTIALGPAQMALHESQRLLMHSRIREEIARVGLLRAQIVILTALTRLRQICCDPRLLGGDTAKPVPSAKLERLLELLDELVPEGRRIVLFSQFTSMLDLIKPELDRRGILWVELTGKTKDRKTPVERFQAGGVPLILVSLKAGGTGLNLTAADTVLLYDPWWNPAIEAQAIDRAHRIGQTKRVFVHRLIAAGTIEEKILTLQAGKAALAETLWSADPTTPAQLDEDDIAFLLG